MDIVNATHLHWQMIRANDSVVRDGMLLEVSSFLSKGGRPSPSLLLMEHRCMVGTRPQHLPMAAFVRFLVDLYS